MENEEESTIRTWSNDSYRYPKRSATRRYLISAIVGVVIVYLLFFVRLPFFIFMPGTAEEIKPMVTIPKGSDAEKGTLMLTTVRVADANMVNYLIGLVHPYEEIQPKTSVLRKGESEQEYSQRQEYVMLTSQASAIQAAYTQAKIPFHINHEGVMVLQTLPGLSGEKVLKPGDVLLKAGDKEVKVAQDLLDSLKGKKAGETIVITYSRKQVEQQATLTLGALPKQEGEQGEPRAGIGVVPADMQAVKADQEDQQVSIKAGEIGGPSAGLMFSLEIYNQLVEDDITKGYRIAGTGTIESDGTVGPIGGIQHKIIAADREKADYFFAPKDMTYKDGTKIENYTAAVERANQIKTKMKIVEIGTMEDALKFLAALPPK
ncbi:MULTISPECIES: SepM family pheromone-processing serine protease [unclassified Paenibacillus]|uniref:SepM family pheromone-processing serine protease n=1 Tax=unclassified Paenibacillus TaxID=185978 RepID=UPI0027837BA5|nr:MULTISPECIES: SepM family pheromone-processing serine protease [unclassified Paenibacillus]MDQ0899857.1 PDZ domain-containing protein [Paenibacillus sp. V4I7]MDQ0914188.1 PDZ domain-containing protein [Paenibacillus sp. V4I5]